MSAHDSSFRARQGSSEDIAVLVGLYAELSGGGRDEVLDAAVRAMAAEQVRGRSANDGAPVDPDEWLTELAEEAYPDRDEAAQLLAFASNVESDARAIILGDGPLPIVLCGSHCEYARGEQLYLGYMYVRSTSDADGVAPDPAAYLGVHVSEGDFEKWQDDGWVPDSDAWQSEVRHRCILHFASMVALWRSNFFAALLSAHQLAQRSSRC